MNSIRKYEIYNIKDENCPLCYKLNQMYEGNILDEKYTIPNTLGEGYCRRIIPSKDIEIVICDMKLYCHTELKGKTKGNLCELSFCLGDTVGWQMKRNSDALSLENFDSLICIGEQYDGTTSINSKKRFYGLTVRISMEKFQGIFEKLLPSTCLTDYKSGNSISYKKATPTATKVVLRQILDCSFDSSIKPIYLEGKVLELFAVHINEIIGGNLAKTNRAKFSPLDMESLYKAKEIIDENITSPPSISQLSRMVYLNEFKLKKGFKELFGNSIRSYVIDKRMEKARIILEEEKVTINEVAILVGYSDASHFAPKFKKKYGVNPNEFIKINGLK